MRVAVVTRYPPLSEGISDYGRHVAHSLASRPEVERVAIVANCTTHDSAPPPGEIDLRRVWRPNDPSTPFRVLRELRRARPDAVWYNVGLSMFGDSPAALNGFLLPALTRRLDLRSIVTLHELPSRDLSEIGFRDDRLRRAGIRIALSLLRAAHAVCVTIDRFRQRLADLDHWDASSVVYLPLCGYAEPSLEPLSESPTVLFFTSHAPHKNLRGLLDAFRIVRRDVPGAHLKIAGIDHPRFPGYLAEARRQFSDEPGVLWLGAVPDEEIRATFRSARVVVAPYNVATGSSATVHQAVSLGRPVVVTDLPEFRAMAAEEDLWLEFSARNDSGNLAEALRRLLVDPGRCKAMTAYNFASAQRNSLAATTDQYVRLLRGTPKFEPLVAVSRCPSGARSP